MEPIKTTIAITGFSQDLGAIERLHDWFGKGRHGFLRADPAPPIAEIEITVRSDKMEHTHRLDLSLSCPQFDQLEQNIIEAVKEFRQLETERLEDGTDRLPVSPV